MLDDDRRNREVIWPFVIGRDMLTDGRPSRWAIDFQSHVERFNFDERTGDLSLEFTAGGMLQFLTNSSGYEGWRTEHGDESIICLGGGALAIFGRK